jgi:hypothetical protein
MVSEGGIVNGVMGKVKKVKHVVTDSGEKRLRELGWAFRHFLLSGTTLDAYYFWKLVL